jgi:hypothetical protein
MCSIKGIKVEGGGYFRSQGTCLAKNGATVAGPALPGA